jgi:hypothetical protein
MPFVEALDRLRARSTLPTALSTREIRQRIEAGIRRASLYSARTVLVPYLEQIRTVVETILNPQPGVRVGESGALITEGMNLADARLELGRLLQRLGYQPDPDKRGTIEDLSSDRRLELVVRTNVEISQGYGQWLQGQDQDILDSYPAQEFYRIAKGRTSRDWPRRWRVAAAAVGDSDAIRILEESGKMIARKDSPIWQALGDGVGLSDQDASDAIGNPYPPFAFNSQMWTRDVDRDRAIELGLVRENEQLQPQWQDFPVREEAR